MEILQLCYILEGLRAWCRNIHGR